MSCAAVDPLADRHHGGAGLRPNRRVRMRWRAALRSASTRTALLQQFPLKATLTYSGDQKEPGAVSTQTFAALLLNPGAQGLSVLRQLWRISDVACDHVYIHIISSLSLERLGTGVAALVKLARYSGPRELNALPLNSARSPFR